MTLNGRGSGLRTGPAGKLAELAQAATRNGTAHRASHRRARPGASPNTIGPSLAAWWEGWTTVLTAAARWDRCERLGWRCPNRLLPVSAARHGKTGQNWTNVFHGMLQMIKRQMCGPRQLRPAPQAGHLAPCVTWVTKFAAEPFPAMFATVALSVLLCGGVHGAATDSDQPIMAASVRGAVVDRARSCPVSGMTTTFRCAAGE